MLVKLNLELVNITNAMKKIFVITMALAFCVSGYAQKKPKINKANKYRINGELAEAKSIIDAATKHEKTKDDGKTWYYRGLIYATIDTTSNSQFQDLKEGALETAIESFNKADELAEGGKEYYVPDPNGGFLVTKSEQLGNYFNHYYNLGVGEFQENNYEEAVDLFGKASYINPSDSNSVINAAFAAHSGGMLEKAKEYYRKAIEMGADSKDYYYNLVGIVSQEGNPEKTLELINEALEVYPNDSDLSRSRIDLFIKLDKIDEALTELQKAVEEEPENPGLHYALGVIHDQMENSDLALISYDNAIKYDPDHYEANYNKGVILLDAANKVIIEQNNLGMSKADVKKSKALEPVIKENLNDALPQWERIVELSPEADKKQNMEYLVFIYSQLGMNKKAVEIQDKIDNMQ